MDALLEDTLEADPGLWEYRTILAAVARAAAVLADGFYSVREVDDDTRAPDEDAHAPCDEAAERELVRAIEAAFPGCHVVGEELGDRGDPDSPMVWIVDPHDGTSAFNQGFRGSAVSVACMVDGEPRFAAVHAWGFPVEPGDLVVWRRGGPIVRNGVPCEQGRPLPLVFVSQKADRSPASADLNASLCEPYPYVALTSIAYRLACVACGDGLAGVSMAAPESWDLAAGAFLLGARGMTLLDADGDPVVLAPDGYIDGLPPMEPVIGGDPDVCATLVPRAWRNVHRLPEEGEPPVRPVRPGRRVDVARLDRLMGFLVALLSDGAAAEPGFSTVPLPLPGGPGFTLLLARHLIRSGHFDPSALLADVSRHARHLPGLAMMPDGRIGGPDAGLAAACGAALLGALDGARSRQVPLAPFDGLATLFDPAPQMAQLRAVHAIFRDAAAGAAQNGPLPPDLPEPARDRLSRALRGCRAGVHAMPRADLLRLLASRPYPYLDPAPPPVPMALWPCDALILAERLYLIGSR